MNDVIHIMNDVTNFLTNFLLDEFPLGNAQLCAVMSRAFYKAVAGLASKERAIVFVFSCSNL